LSAQAQGLPTDYRIDCDPRAILGFECFACRTEVCACFDLKDESIQAVGRKAFFGLYPCNGIPKSIEM